MKNEEANIHPQVSPLIARWAVAAAFVATLAPSELHAGPRGVRLGAAPIRTNLPDGARLDGALLRDPNGEIDVVYGAARFPIPNMQVFAKMGFNPATIIQLKPGQLQQLGKTPLNGTLLSNKTLGIYLIVDGKRRHVPNMEVFKSAGFSGKPVHSLWDGALEQIPDEPWPANTTRVAREAGAPMQPASPRTYESSGEISGPVCSKGGHVSSTVEFMPSPGAVSVHVRAQATNSCVTDDLGPTVEVRLLDASGNRIAEQLVLDIPKTPGRGFNRPTNREAETSKSFNTSLDVSKIEVSYRNRYSGNTFISMITSKEFWEIVGTVVSIVVAAV